MRTDNKAILGKNVLFRRFFIMGPYLNLEKSLLHNTLYSLSY